MKGDILSYGPRGRSTPDGSTVLTDIEQILAKSRAAEPFKTAVRSYHSGGGAEHIRVDG